MPTLRPVSSAAAASSVAKPTLSAADLKTARALKPTILEIMKRVRLVPAPAASLPKFDAAKNLWKATNGHLLVSVTLSKPPAGMSDGYTTRGLVDPKTNQFWVLNQGGIAGTTSGQGPLSLPEGQKFTSKSYSQADVHALEKAANAKAVSVKPKVHHFEPTVLNAAWSYGMGVRPLPGMYAGPAIRGQVVFPFVDIKPDYKVKLNEKTHTFTVTVDGTSDVTVHSRQHTVPVDFDLHVQRPSGLGGNYKIKFVDPKGVKLFETSFMNMLPA